MADDHPNLPKWYHRSWPGRLHRNIDVGSEDLLFRDRGGLDLLEDIGWMGKVLIEMHLD